MGCIITQNLLVPDASAQEIDDAVAAAGVSAGADGNANSGAVGDDGTLAPFSYYDTGI